MLVYEIKKDLAPIFSDFVPEYVLRMVGKKGYHSLGEVFSTDDADYPSAFLQYYDGSVKKSHDPILTYLYVREGERNESSAWSLLREMERRLVSAQIPGIGVRLSGDAIDRLGPYLKKRGFREQDGGVDTVATTTGALISERLLALPDSKAVHSLKDVPKSEIKRVLSSFGEKTLAQLMVDPDISADSFSFDLSVVYRDENANGIFLVTKLPEGGLMARMLRCTGKDSSTPLICMMSKTAKIIKKHGAYSVPVYIPCYNDKTIALVKSLNPDIALEPVWQGECKYE